MSISATSKRESELNADDKAVADVLAEVQAELEVLAVRRRALPAGGFDPDLAAATASLTKSAIAVMAEQRQRAKDRKRSLSSFTDDEIIEYLRSLPERRREGIVIALQGVSLAGRPLF